MEYLIFGIIALYFIYKILVYFGRKNAINVLCQNFQLDIKKVKALKDADITKLHITLESSRSKTANGSMSLGENEQIEKLLNQFR